MLYDILGLDNMQWHPLLISNYKKSFPCCWSEFDLLPNSEVSIEHFHGCVLLPNSEVSIEQFHGCGRRLLWNLVWSHLESASVLIMRPVSSKDVISLICFGLWNLNIPQFFSFTFVPPLASGYGDVVTLSACRARFIGFKQFVSPQQCQRRWFQVAIWLN